MAYQLVVRNNPFGDKSEAGRAWLDYFLQRHKETLSIRKPTGTSYACANGFNVESVNTFFDMLEKEYDRKTFEPDPKAGCSLAPDVWPSTSSEQALNNVAAKAGCSLAPDVWPSTSSEQAMDNVDTC
ncbi:hypothetical protein JTB14_005092 [Gonioctena quinquepunctata]|nr:hypothetical protein JTB14_005092 [Gonioctena quinquepunctata]